MYPLRNRQIAIHIYIELLINQNIDNEYLILLT